MDDHGGFSKNMRNGAAAGPRGKGMPVMTHRSDRMDPERIVESAEAPVRAAVEYAEHAGGRAPFIGDDRGPAMIGPLGDERPRRTRKGRKGAIQAPTVTPWVGQHGPREDEIRARAHEIYVAREYSGQGGDALADWLRAELEVRERCDIAVRPFTI